MYEAEYDFCSQYLGEFLSLINFPEDTDYIPIIEKYREKELEGIRENCFDSPMYSHYVDNINADYDKKIFDFIKEEVAKKEPGLFNYKINVMKELIANNVDIAVKLNMIADPSKFDDYYYNYQIALEVVLEHDYTGEAVEEE